MVFTFLVIFLFCGRACGLEVIVRRFFDPDFDLERIEVAARLAAVHEDIAAMPMGGM